MSTLIQILLAVNLLVGLLIILFTLMQRPKQEGLGAAFGGGMTENLFGAQTTNVLVSITRWLGGIFLVLCLAISALYARQGNQKSAVEQELLSAPAVEQKEGAPAASPEATPAGEATPAPAPEATPAETTPAPETTPEAAPAEEATPATPATEEAPAAPAESPAAEAPSTEAAAETATEATAPESTEAASAEAAAPEVTETPADAAP